MSEIPDESVLLNSSKAAELLGCSRPTLYNWHIYGHLPVPIVIRRHLHWKREELLRWLEAGCPDREEWKKYNQTYQ